METKTETLTILGTGPAGLTAAIYSARANLNPLIIEGAQPGGQLTITSEVENYPGFVSPILGPDLMTAFRKQAERFGSRFLQGQIIKANLRQSPIILESSENIKIQTKALIIATGASAKWIGLPSEKRLLGKGVSSCATCDGFFFRNQDIAVVGGGDTALEEATFLTRFAKTVTVIHRREHLRASQIMQDKSFKNPKIKFIWDSAVEEILGEKEVTSIRLKNLKTNQIQELKIHGLFVAIGHEPNTHIFRDQLLCDPAGYIITEPGSTRTNMPGVFASGDVADHVYRQAITAAGTGCMAALDAEKYLGEHS
ncbi:MAG: thioredoxin-disulfide reductase [Deltaproteobacteria bacterium]|nr:thioredoxin-disulfide reductase [Deltaproteobacteria bacterium]